MCTHSQLNVNLRVVYTFKIHLIQNCHFFKFIWEHTPRDFRAKYKVVVKEREKFLDLLLQGQHCRTYKRE